MFGIFKKKKKEEGEDTMDFNENLDFATDFESIKNVISKREMQPQNPMPQAFPPAQIQQPFQQPPFQPPVQQPVQPQQPKEEPKKEELPKIKFEERPELFIKIDRYKDILDTLNHIVVKVKEMEGILSELKDIKSKESQKLSDWERELEDLRDRINEILENLKSE